MCENTNCGNCENKNNITEKYNKLLKVIDRLTEWSPYHSDYCYYCDNLFPKHYDNCPWKELVNAIDEAY
jgi:hypothetical protein